MVLHPSAVFFPLSLSTLSPSHSYPYRGLYANMIAQVLSQIVSHFAIYYHRNVCAAADHDDYIKEATLAMEEAKATQAALDRAEGRGLQMSVVGDSSGEALAGDVDIDHSPSESTADSGSDQRPRKSRMSFAPPSLPRASVSGGAQAGGATRQQRRNRRASTWIDAGTHDIPVEDAAIAEVRESLRDHVYNVEGTRFRLTRPFGVIVDVLLVLVVALLFGGSVLPSFMMEVWGLAGVAMEFGKEGSSTTG